MQRGPRPLSRQSSTVDGDTFSSAHSSRTVSFFSSRSRHTSDWRDWSSDVCSSDLGHSTSNIHDEPCQLQLIRLPHQVDGQILYHLKRLRLIQPVFRNQPREERAVPPPSDIVSRRNR